ncbi:hypothetical protein, partial [Sulfitobacter sp. HGT1]|uniref:hypothetical protein n=1 Tax=Sulfitobacter sp. HGT1 TaxID=2735435 RepID=UPI0015949AB4
MNYITYDPSVKFVLSVESYHDITNLGFQINEPSSDAGVYVQRVMDADFYLKMDTVLPEGNVYWGTSVYLYAKPAKILGKGMQRTTIIPSSSLLFDTDRIPSGIDSPEEYEVNALIISLRINGGSGSTTSTQRDLLVGGFSYDAEGTGYERLVHIVFSGGQSHSEFSNIYHRASNSVYYAHFLSDGASRHFYITFKHLRGQDSNHQVTTNWQPDSGLGTQMGSTWNFEDCSGGKYRKSPYDLNGVLYSNAQNSSADNVYKGSYVWDIKNSNVTLTGCAVESRYESRDDANTGSGLIRCYDSDVTVNGGNYIGGDSSGDGTGSISDYDDGSGNVSGSLIICESSGGGSTLNLVGAQVNMRSGSQQADRFPVMSKGSRSVVRYSTTFNLWQADDLVCESGGKGVVLDIDGNITLKDDTSGGLITQDILS